ncbi:unnamed protein product [Symbiodinium microadriaticum]|nr:unnamed protein product [Symbiodinium microadriaticum]
MGRKGKKASKVKRNADADDGSADSAEHEERSMGSSSKRGRSPDAVDDEPLESGPVAKKAKGSPKAKAKSSPKPKAKAKSSPKPKAKAKSSPKPKAKAKSGPKAKAKSGPKAKAKSSARAPADQAVSDDTAWGLGGFKYPKTFAGRWCPNVEHSYGWYVWRHIARTFIEIIVPSIIGRSRSKKELEYFSFAKKNFVASGLDVVRPDVEEFFVEQAYVYIRDFMHFEAQGTTNENSSLCRDGCISIPHEVLAGDLDFIELFAGCAALAREDVPRFDPEWSLQWICQLVGSGLQLLGGCLSRFNQKVYKVRIWMGQFGSPTYPRGLATRLVQVFRSLQLDVPPVPVTVHGGTALDHFSRATYSDDCADANLREVDMEKQLASRCKSPEATIKATDEELAAAGPEESVEYRPFYKGHDERDVLLRKIQEQAKELERLKKEKSTPHPVTRRLDRELAQDSEDEESKAEYNRMRAKTGRLCSRTEEFMRKVEVWKETSKFRELATDGGFYSESDMKKPVSEGGLGLKEKCKYDDEETEYWVDHRTHGQVSGMANSFQPGNLDDWNLKAYGTCSVENGKDKVSDTILRHMQESVSCRDKLAKFVEKLDDRDATAASWVITCLGTLYDDLAKLQAEAKVKQFSDSQPALMFTKIPREWE